MPDTPVGLLNGARQTGKTTVARGLGEGGRGMLHAGRFRHARTGVEIKASATVTAPDFAALQALRGQLGERFQAGIVLYLGEHVVAFGDKTWLAPLPTLWEP